MAYKDVVFSQETGKRIIMGTAWPIEDVVRREGPRQWVAIVGLCNGVAEFSRTFKTKKAAIAYCTGTSGVPVEPEDDPNLA